jgi:hypothetical protein
MTLPLRLYRNLAISDFGFAATHPKNAEAQSPPNPPPRKDAQEFSTQRRGWAEGKRGRGLVEVRTFKR